MTLQPLWEGLKKELGSKGPSLAIPLQLTFLAALLVMMVGVVGSWGSTSPAPQNPFQPHTISFHTTTLLFLVLGLHHLTYETRCALGMGIFPVSRKGCLIVRYILPMGRSPRHYHITIGQNGKGKQPLRRDISRGRGLVSFPGDWEDSDSKSTLESINGILG